MSRDTGRSSLRLPGIPPEYRPLAAAVTMVLATGAGYLGQRALDHPPVSLWAWALLLVGAAVFALLTHREALEQPRPEATGQLPAPRLRFLAPSLTLVAFAFPGFAGNQFRPLPTLAWLGGLALLYLSFSAPSSAPAVPAGRAPAVGLARPQEAGRGARLTPAQEGWPTGALAVEQEPSAGSAPTQRDEARPNWGRAAGIHLSWHTLALLGILVVAAVLRLYQLDTIPREMGVDMPLNYENAREIMQGRFMVFCPRYPGRESLFFYLLAAYGKLFNLSYFSIKFVSVLVGLATIPALYALGRDLFDRQVGLLAAAFLAVSKWHVILSRSGYRAVMVPLVVTLVILTTVRALRRGRATDFVVAGIALGLGMYTYNSFLVVPPALAVALAIELGLRGRAVPGRYGWGLLGLALAALVVFLPLGRYALEEPKTYLFRVATRVTSIEAPLPGDLARVLAGNLWRAAGMFNLRGDAVFYINVPHQRELGAISGPLFVFGLAYALLRWRRGHNAMLVVFLASLILPTALAVAFPHEVPSAVRATGVLVPAYLLVALPLTLLRRRLVSLWPRDRRQPFTAFLALPPRLRWRWHGRVGVNVGVLTAVILVGLLAAELGETWQAYFQDYVRHLPGRNYAISLELARVLDEFEPEGQSYVKVWPHWFDGNALRAQLRVKPRSWDWELVELDAGKPPLSTAQGRVLFVVHPEDHEALQLLRSCFPQGVAVGHWDYEGRVAFVAFYGER